MSIHVTSAPKPAQTGGREGAARTDDGGLDDSRRHDTGAASGGVRVVLRLEGLAVLILALAANAKWGMSWAHFALFFLSPDLSMLGYIAGPRFGALSYNVGHSYLGAMICTAIGVLTPAPWYLGAGILWFAHIGLDRALGYGLKYGIGFGATHLGAIGRFRLARR